MQSHHPDRPNIRGLKIRFRPSIMQGFVIFLGILAFASVGGYAQDDTTISIQCSPSSVFVNEGTSCTATVTNIDNNADPTGTVTFSISVGAGSFTGNPCALGTGTANDTISTCSVTYTPSSSASATHTLQASYASNNAPAFNNSGPASTNVNVQRRVTSTSVSCTPNSLFINEVGTCTVTVSDTTTQGTKITPSGNVSLASSGTGTFSNPGNSCMLSGSLGTASCTVDYEPTASTAVTTIHAITATFAETTQLTGSMGLFNQIVNWRNTTMTLACQPGNVFVNQASTCTATVVDITAAGTKSHPGGDVQFFTTSGGTFSSPSCTLAMSAVDTSTCNVTYTPTDGTDLSHSVQANYVGGQDLIHASSSSTTSVTAKLRPTDFSASCTPANYSGTPPYNFTCTATVTEKAGTPGTPSTPAGTVSWELNPGMVMASCALVAGMCSSNLVGNDGDALVYAATGTYAHATSPAVHADSGAVDNMTKSIPAGSPVNVTAGSIALTSVCLGLSAAGDIVGAIPDFDFGDGAGAALSISSDLLCLDLDGDGIYGLLELIIGTNDADIDSDDDGMDDQGEVYEANGFATAGQGIAGDDICPDPDVADSDGDFLKDGAEGNTFQTDFCNSDTDGDGLTDGQEAATASDPNDDKFATNSLSGPFTDARDHSNPLVQDTDGDGLSDAFEITEGCSGGQDGFVNSADSDEDGLPDGIEPDADTADSSGNAGELSSDTLASMCDPDSDDDGLGDQAEFSFGTSLLDWDTDNDGLSDYEELNVYFTNPLSTDTDGDGADGNILSRDSTIAPLLSGHSGAGTIDCLSDCEEGLSSFTQGTFVGEPRDETDPLTTDTDGDGINDDLEFDPGCSGGADGYANSFDSDGDGASDGIEFTNDPALDGDIADSNGNNGELNDDALNTICDPDSDGDNMLDGHELGQGTDLRDWDTDDDGISDWEELTIYFTNPNNPDSDFDTADGVIAARNAAVFPILTGHSGTGDIDCLSDCEEILSSTDQFNSPVDFRDETDPLQTDTDGDGINDDIEFGPGCNDGPGGPGTGTFLFDGYANSFDSDADGLRDLEDAVADVFDASSITINQTPVTRTWASYPETPAPGPGGTKAASPDGLNDGELSTDGITGICDPDSDDDGLSDGEEFHIGTDPYDWDTDDDGRDDGEYLGEGPIPTDPFDFDTDDDGLGDGVEVFGSNTTNPVNADTDGDGLCDGGSTTPASNQFGAPPTGGVDGAGGNPLCYTGVNDHPNPNGFGEDLNGDGTLPFVVLGDSFSSGCTPTGGACETNPNNPDSDSDGNGDGVETLAFSTSRSTAFIDVLGRPSRVNYPGAANPPFVFSCMNPLDSDSDDDGLSDGIEDYNHDGNFDFLPQDFDFPIDSLGGHFGTEPEETNPCDADSDDDSNPGSFNSFGLSGGNSSDAEERNRRTNPLDFDSDNDLLDDGVEVAFVCVMPGPVLVDDDGDFLIDEDPVDGIDNDGDGKIDEDPVNFFINFVPNLDPLEQDSDADGFIDGLEDFNFNDMYEPGIGETNPCATLPIPLVSPIGTTPPDSIPDTDNDGFGDEDERSAGTDPNDANSHPVAAIADLDFDGEVDDRYWLEDPDGDGFAEYVAMDINSNIQTDARIEIIEARDLSQDDFDGDGAADDCRYVITYAFANGRQLHERVLFTLFDFDCDMSVDDVVLTRL